ITLEVNDGQETTSATVILEVITPTEAVEVLIGFVQDSSLPRNRKTPLLASLNAAESSFSRGHLTPGANQLGAFQHKLGAQVAKSNSVLAQQLHDVAQEIIDAVTSSHGPLPLVPTGPSPRPPLPPPPIAGPNN